MSRLPGKRRGRGPSVGVGCALLCLAMALPAAAYQPPGLTERMSVSPGGAGGNTTSYFASASADGRFVAFLSQASNLVTGDTNNKQDVFLRDRRAGTTRRISVSSTGEQGFGDSLAPAISDDGRFVAFYSDTPDLVPGDTNGTWDIFVRDVNAEKTERVSVSSSVVQSNGASFEPGISADGRFVVFTSEASNLVPGDTNPNWEVFVHDRQTGSTERVSVASDGTQGSNVSRYPSISSDGRFVAFHSVSTNLVAGDTNTRADVFLRDRQAGTTERVSLAYDGAQADGLSSAPSVSADGRYIVFESAAQNLIPSDTNGQTDIFVRDRVLARTTRVSVSSAGAEGNNVSEDPTVSDDGRSVAFWSGASNLVPGDTNAHEDVFVHDRETGATERVSVSSSGAQGEQISAGQLISADGRYVGFGSIAPNLVPGDSGTQDAFLRDRGPAFGFGELSEWVGGRTVHLTGWVRYAGEIVSSGQDPADDGSTGAKEAGADLTSVSVSYRPENEDLFARIGVASLPSFAAGNNRITAGVPGVVYGLAFELRGARYELRARPGIAGLNSIQPIAPSFTLHRCDQVCTPVSAISGGIGTTGQDVMISVPLAALGAQEGDALTSLRAFTALAEPMAGQPATLDEKALPDARVPTMRVSAALVPAGTPESEVDFAGSADLDAGRFFAAFETESMPPGSYDVWVRASRGNAHRSERRSITLD